MATDYYGTSSSQQQTGNQGGWGNFWQDPNTWYSILGLAGDVYGSYQGMRAAEAANKTNVMLAREQRAWETDMSNTAVQRRAADVEKAGFNRVLAATGPGASTPSQSAPQVEPTFRPEWTKGSVTAAALMRAQLDQMQAQTQNISADTRTKNVTAKIAEKYGLEGAEIDVENKSLTTGEIKARIRKLGLDSDLTAAQLERFNKTMDSMIALAQQQARAGKLDLDALENIAKVGGMEAGKMKDIIRIFIDLFRK